MKPYSKQRPYTLTRDWERMIDLGNKWVEDARNECLVERGAFKLKRRLIERGPLDREHLKFRRVDEDTHHDGCGIGVYGGVSGGSADENQWDGELREA
jgi:hypothetical protein